MIKSTLIDPRLLLRAYCPKTIVRRPHEKLVEERCRRCVSSFSRVVGDGQRCNRRAYTRSLTSLPDCIGDLPLNEKNVEDYFGISVAADGSSVVISQSSRRGRNAEVNTPLPVDTKFPAWWLWMQDPQGIHSSSGQRRHSLGYTDDQSYVIRDARMVYSTTDVVGHFELHSPPPTGSYHSRGGIYSTAKGMEECEEDCNSDHRTLLQVRWVNGNLSYYDWEWLCQFRSHSSSDFPTAVTPDLAIGAIHNSNVVELPTLDYEFVLHTRRGTMEALEAIIEHGALLVQNSPIPRDHPDCENHTPSDATGTPSDQVVASLGKCLSGGRLSHGSLYGDTFRVVSQPNAQNIAYTRSALAPHQDLVYYESKPFLQLLHCISNAGEGGESVLVDAMAATEYLRTVDHNLFNVLCHVEATFIKQRPGADIVSFKPHIRISPQTGEVIEVNWAPPFEGPLSLYPRSPIHDPSLSDDYPRAYQALECLLDIHAVHAGRNVLELELRRKLQDYSRRYTWERVLEPGDILVFNNQRMCHGRRSFSSCEGGKTSRERHLIGCYTDAMETINTYRVLRREHRGFGGRVRSIGNGTRGSYV